MSLEGLIIAVVVLVVLLWLVSQYLPEPFRMICLVLLGLCVLVIVIKLLFAVLGGATLRIGAALVPLG